MIYLVYLIFYILLNLGLLIFLKFLQHKKGLKRYKILLILLFINLLFVFAWLAFWLITNHNITVEFNNTFDPDGDGFFSLENLTEEEDNIANRYFGDGGRNIFVLCNMIFCGLNYIFILLLSFAIDFVVHLKKEP